MYVLPKQLFQRMQFLWKRTFVRNVLTLQIGGVFMFGFGIIRSVILARMLGIEGFGLYAVGASLVGVLGIFMNFGHSEAFIVYLAEAFSPRKEKEVRRAVKYFVVVGMFSAALAGVLMLLAPLFAGHLYDQNVQLIAAMAVTGLFASAVNIPANLISALLQVLRQVRLLVVLDNISMVLQLAFAVGFILNGQGALGVFLGLLAANMLMMIVRIGILIRLWSQNAMPGIWSSIRHGGSIRPYVVQGVWITMDKNVNTFYTQGLLFSISLFASPALVGIAQIALRISDIPASLMLTHVIRMTQTTLPALKNKGIAVLRRQCALLIKHALLFHSLTIFACILTFPIGIVLLYGWEYVDVIVPTIWLLLIRLLQPLNTPNVSLLRMFRKMHIATAWNAVRVPLELGILVACLTLLPSIPITGVLVGVVLLHQIGGVVESAYVYGVLLRR